MELADYRHGLLKILTAQLAIACGTAVFRGTPLDNRCINASKMCWYLQSHTKHTASDRLLSSFDLILLTEFSSGTIQIFPFGVNTAIGQKVQELHPIMPAHLLVDRYTLHRVSREECTILLENVPWVKIHRYNAKHLYPKLNGYGDNSERSLNVWQLLHTYWLLNTY